MADQAGLNTVLFTTNLALAAGTAVIGTVTALQAGTWTANLAAGANAIGTVTALQGGTWSVIPGTANSTAGTVGPISTTTAQTIIGAAAGSTLFVTSLQFGNTGTVVATCSISDVVTSKFVIAVGNTFPIVFATPLQTSLGSALTITLGTISTSIYCTAQGHY